MTARGAKGGLLSGIVTRGTYLRRDDGTLAVAVLLVRGLDQPTTQRLSDNSQAFNDVLPATLENPNSFDCLR